LRHARQPAAAASAHQNQVALEFWINQRCAWERRTQPILDDFRAQYAAMIQRYNQYAEATAKRGQVADSASFVVQRDNLVQATRDKLRALSFDAQSRFDTHVQNEKKQMRGDVPVAR
jgi:hypothetical protein